jgi:tetratricopeptide (TPR) repeat protein
VGLAVLAAIFGWCFKSNYDRFMADNAVVEDSDPANVPTPATQQKMAPRKTGYHLGLWGSGLVLCVVALGALLAHQVSQHFGQRVVDNLFDVTEEAPKGPDYEAAEQEWAKGNYLEAIRLLREFLEKNPRAQHVSLRIAEIYEKDLANPLAAALEYEEVLKQKLPPERWGWAAIHLSNLYTGKLNQLPKSVALLRRIVGEFGETAAAEKARARLDQLADEGIIAPLPALASPGQPPPSEPTLPPGFGPKKG